MCSSDLQDQLHGSVGIALGCQAHARNLVQLQQVWGLALALGIECRMHEVRFAVLGDGMNPVGRLRGVEIPCQFRQYRSACIAEAMPQFDLGLGLGAALP